MNLDDATLRDLAGDRSFERGADYARRGRVRLEQNDERRLRAEVHGQQRYRVEIDAGGDELAWMCNCPVGEFCKHLVAAAIAAREPPAATRQDSGDDAELDAFLRAQPADRLAAWLGEIAREHPSVEKRLRLRQAQSDPAALKKEIAKQIRAHGFLDWRASARFAQRLASVIDALDDTLQAHPNHALELCEFALTKLLKRCASADDSSGAIGTRLTQVAALYRRAIERGARDDAALGRRFLEVQRHDEWGFTDLAEFWPLLGPLAQHAYATAVDAEYSALGPAHARDDSDRWSREFSIVHRMEQLAAVRGDVDTLIRVTARDLSSGHAFERLVAICLEAGRGREATTWAERGYRAHPKWRGMRALLADRCRHDGLNDRALELDWEDFREDPSPAHWQRLKTAAGDQWQEHRRRALEHVERAEKSAGKDRDVSRRVRLLLADGDVDQARELGERHSVVEGLLEPLADALASSHAPSAAAFLRRAVDAALPGSSPPRYADLAASIARACVLDRSAQSDEWLAAIRARYRARRKLMALLDEALP
ncbi:MAG TPA: SWIM zinc finger family protein [Gammaproteobacteria bacterium]|nr:SWIM zinc finger family protein [Gammaproteobacteria bacterium]